MVQADKVHERKARCVMMAKKILFPTDFSTSSEVALEQATALARDLGAEMLIVHVAETPVTYRSADIYYGIYEPDDSAVRKMLHAVVPTDPVVYYEHRLLHGEPITIHGDGEQTRDFVNVADVARANLRAAQTPGLSGAFNIASGSRITINRLAELMTQTSATPAVIQHGPPRAGDVRHSLADISAAAAAFGFRPSVSLETGLQDYMGWSRRALVAAR